MAVDCDFGSPGLFLEVWGRPPFGILTSEPTPLGV
jgi:hypothetical protein